MFQLHKIDLHFLKTKHLKIPMVPLLQWIHVYSWRKNHNPKDIILREGGWRLFLIVSWIKIVFVFSAQGQCKNTFSNKPSYCFDNPFFFPLYSYIYQCKEINAPQWLFFMERERGKIINLLFLHLIQVSCWKFLR